MRVNVISTPTVSVIIPTYNRAHLVGRAIRSVLNQTFKDLEIYVVDDGSTDNTEDVVRGFQDPRIKYDKHEVNKGAPAARNLGINTSTGEYIAFLDSDDEWLPEKLEKQLEVFRSSELSALGAVVCGQSLISANGESRYKCVTLKGRVFDQVLRSSHVGGPGSSLLIRRSVVDAGALFDEDFPAYQDLDFVLQVARTWEFETVPDGLIRQYLCHGGPQVWSGARIEAGQLCILRKYFKELSAVPHVLALHHKRLARNRYKVGDMDGVRRHLWQAFKAVPINPLLLLWIVTAKIGRLPFRASMRASRELSRLLVCPGLMKRVPSPFQ